MESKFLVGDKPAQFWRDPRWGRAELVLGDEATLLQSEWNPFIHVSYRTRKVWRRDVDGHSVEIVLVRQQLEGGARPMSFTVSVDGVEAAAATGT